MSSLGFCPFCGADTASRERRPNGFDVCANNHRYPSKESVPTPTACQTYRLVTVMPESGAKYVARFHRWVEVGESIGNMSTKSVAALIELHDGSCTTVPLTSIWFEDRK